MKRLLFLFILLFAVLFTVSVIAQEFGSLRKGHRISFPEKIQKLVLDPLPAGTYSVGTGGYFPTIDSAFNKLSVDGIAGVVILELIDTLYTAPSVQFGFVLNGPIPGAGPNSRVIIKPAANKNVTIEGNNEGLLVLNNTSYVTIDGIDLTGSTTLTVHTLQTPFPFNDTIDFFNNSDHNIVQNVTFISEDSGNGPGFLVWGSVFAPDSNLIQNNFIKKGGIAIYVSAEFSAVEAIGNIIRGNIVGSETDSLISWGIQAQFTRNTIIENNIVHNIRRGTVWQDITPGINSYSGNGDIIRNNIVHNIHSNGVMGAIGILLSGDPGQYGIDNQVYNNMVYDIQSTSTQSNSRVTGIQIWNQNSPKIYYNSVYLSGTGNGANPFGSAAFYIYGGFGGSSGVDLKNNIFVNTRDESPYFASSIYDYSASNLTSDYNDLYYELNQYNALVRIGSTNYNTLADWQATGKDLNSVNEMPNFTSPFLHIDETIPTYLESGATPIAWISKDFDGDTRNAITPDIGADEFDGVPVSQTTFQLSVNDGWNMVSVPGINPGGMGVTTWWSGKDPGADVFKYSGGYVSVTTTAPAEGYWMKNAGAQVYNYPSIQIVTHNPIAGASGWNLIGGYELSVLTANIITNPAGLQDGPVYEYSGGYNVATNLVPGYGYWIKLSGAGQIIVPEVLAKGTEPVEYFKEDWGKIMLTDATGINYTLYAVNGEVDLNKYELPPMPPAGMFDIRFSSGRIAEDINSSPETIEMSGVTYPLTVRVEGMDIRLMDETGSTVNVNLKSGEDVVISDATIQKLMVTGELIPAVYALEQNYPNPFNQTTTIKFSIPEATNVKLSIYNVLGEKVTELVNSKLEAGRYSYQWNAQNVATGMYIYELRADEFVSVKKMVLMK